MVNEVRPITDDAAVTVTPALVLGSPSPTSLGVIRILGRKGIPHFAVGTRGSFVSRSRWHPPCPDPQGKEPSPSDLPQFLARLPFERMTLIPCADQWVAAVAGLDPSHTARFPASQAPPETIQILLDKGRFAEAAARLGIPHPRTICLNPQDDLATLPDEVFQGAFLKPRDSRAFQKRYGMKATRFKTRSEAIAFVREARWAGLELMLQEYIPGEARQYHLHGFVDRGGAVCACFAYRWLRRHPRERDFSGTGGAYGVSIAPEDMSQAVQDLKRLLGALRFRGVFNAQFKYDERDGLFKVLEVNARPGLWVGFAAACGVNVVEMAYRDALGLPVEPVAEYEIGRHALDPLPDLVAGCHLLREGRLSPWIWMRSWLGATQLTFRWDDPIPGLVYFFGGARRAVRRRLGGRKVRQGAAIPRQEAAERDSGARVVS